MSTGTRFENEAEGNEWAIAWKHVPFTARQTMSLQRSNMRRHMYQTLTLYSFALTKD